MTGQIEIAQSQSELAPGGVAPYGVAPPYEVAPPYGVAPQTLRREAWSAGQIQSKLWLCEELERNFAGRHPVIWVLGGWYGVLPSMIFTRGRLQPRHICSLDLDGTAVEFSNILNDTWRIEGRYSGVVADCNSVDFGSGELAPQPDIVINTSCEHFTGEWITRIPHGTYLVTQATDMPDPEHVNRVFSLSEMHARFQPHYARIDYSGEIQFSYVSLKFKRFMLMGQV